MKMAIFRSFFRKKIWKQHTNVVFRSNLADKKEEVIVYKMCGRTCFYDIGITPDQAVNMPLGGSKWPKNGQKIDFLTWPKKA